MAHARHFVATIPCVQCGTPFRLRSDAAAKPDRGKFCSMKCSNVARSKPLTADIAVVRTLYVDKQKTLREIAEAHGTTWKHVKAALVADGVEMTPGRRATHGMGRRYRQIAERSAGRPVRKHEVVHHLDCDRTNNKTANLVIVTRKRHADLHSQLASISAELFTAGLITFNPTTGYVLANEVRALME